jgi:uncharacterized protein (UPF0248 family)
MQSIKDLINKILWDKKENPKDYELGIVDRFTKETDFMNFESVKKIEANFLTVDFEDELKEIPLHRIRAVKRCGKLIWQRP